MYGLSGEASDVSPERHARLDDFEPARPVQELADHATPRVHVSNDVSHELLWCDHLDLTAAASLDKISEAC